MTAGQCEGDLGLAGFVYSPDEVVSIQAAECRNDQGGIAVPMAWVLPVMASAVGLVGWVHLIHR